MEISPEQLNKFRAIYQTKFGIDLTPQEALEKAIALLNVVQLTYQPMTEADLLRVQERQKKTLLIPK